MPVGVVAGILIATVCGAVWISPASATSPTVSLGSIKNDGATYHITGSVSAAKACLGKRKVSLKHDGLTSPVTATTDATGAFAFDQPSSFVNPGNDGFIAGVAKRVIRHGSRRTVCSAGTSPQVFHLAVRVGPVTAWGTVAGASPSTISCNGVGVCDEFEIGSVVLTETPTSLFHFGSWSGPCSGTASTCSPDMTQDRTVGANFCYLFIC